MYLDVFFGNASLLIRMINEFHISSAQTFMKLLRHPQQGKICDREHDHSHDAFESV